MANSALLVAVTLAVIFIGTSIFFSCMVALSTPDLYTKSVRTL